VSAPHPPLRGLLQSAHTPPSHLHWQTGHRSRTKQVRRHFRAITLRGLTTHTQSTPTHPPTHPPTHTPPGPLRAMCAAGMPTGASRRTW
jgi:hypothetical protein